MPALVDVSDSTIAFIVVYSVLLGWLVYCFYKYTTMLGEEE
jgi:hypothetical protein